MIKFTSCAFSSINILAMVYVMYFILFQCIRMIESEKYTIDMTFCKIVNFTFLALKLKKTQIGTSNK